MGGVHMLLGALTGAAVVAFSNGIRRIPLSRSTLGGGGWREEGAETAPRGGKGVAGDSGAGEKGVGVFFLASFPLRRPSC